MMHRAGTFIILQLRRIGYGRTGWVEKFMAMNMHKLMTYGTSFGLRTGNRMFK